MSIFPDWRGEMQALFTFLGLLLIAALIVGVVLGNSEWLNPSMHAAKVDKVDAEAAAIRAQTAYDEEKRRLELMVAEEKARLEIEAIQRRDASRQELRKPLAITGLITGSMVATCAAVSVAYYSIAKARALSGGSGARRTAGRGHRAGPAMPGEEQEGTPEHDPNLSLIERANIRPWRATYDGFLAYCYDFFLGPNRMVIFYPKGIAPAVAEFYRTVLRQARIITEGSSGRYEWTVQRRITNIRDVRSRISRQAFDRLGGP